MKRLVAPAVSIYNTASPLFAHSLPTHNSSSSSLISLYFTVLIHSYTASQSHRFFITVSDFRNMKKELRTAVDMAGWSAEEERMWEKLASAEVNWAADRLRKYNTKKTQAPLCSSSSAALIEELLRLTIGGETKDSSDKSDDEPMPDVDSAEKQGKQGISRRRKAAVVVPLPVVETSLQNHPNSKNRVTIRERLAESLRKVANEVDYQTLEEEDAISCCDPVGVAAIVETELFSAWGPYNGPNKLKYRSVLFNIRDDNNPDFRRKVLSGRFPPDLISQLNTEDMASDARRLEIQNIREKSRFNC